MTSKPRLRPEPETDNMENDQPNQDAAPDSAKDNNLVPEPARPSEEIVPLQRMGRLCARWRDKARDCEQRATTLSRDHQHAHAACEAAKAEAIYGLLADIELEVAGTEPTD